MSTLPQKDHPDCTERCKSTQHGDIITAAISKRSISDWELCSYLNYICNNCDIVRDSLGRTSLHVAASCGRVHLVRWLIEKRRALINARDEESGFTALHRAVFYGKIDVAIELIKLGASMLMLDADCLTVLDHAMKDGLHPNREDSGEIYVWGTNTNHSLGPQQARSIPELLDVFHKEWPHEIARQICVENFHSIIVTNSGRVFSCGHGRGGRLGLGIEETVVIPKMVNFPDQSDLISCIQASISRDHSLFLGSDGFIYSCGLNTHRVLGLTPPPGQVLVPKQLRHLSEPIVGICSGRYHSVAWGMKVLYTWGLNAGQLGPKLGGNDKYILTPKVVTLLNFADNSIKSVSASDGATAICTIKGDIYIIHEYQCRKIASRQLNVVDINIVGGKLNSSLSKDLSSDVNNKELKVVALTNTGNLQFWQESDPQLCRCIFSLNRAIIVRQVLINFKEILFVSEDGEAFQGNIKPRKRRTTINDSAKSAFHKFLERDDCIEVKITKFPRIHRAICIQSDPKGHDYCVIQAPPYKKFEFPEMVHSEMPQQLLAFFQETHENDDINDVVFKVNDRCFLAHRFIVSSRCSYLEKILNDNDKKIIQFDDVDANIFEQFLLYIYTGNCQLINCGTFTEKSNGNWIDDGNDLDYETDKLLSAFEVYGKQQQQQQKLKANTQNPVRMLHAFAKRMGCDELQQILGCLDMQKFVIRNKTNCNYKTKFVQFDRLRFPDLCDVTLKCWNSKEIRAHKCILAARLEYFNNMFSTRWHNTDTSVVSLPFSDTVVGSLLEFLYTDTLSSLDNREVDHLFKVLILADQLFVDRLKEQCEFLLTNLLTLRNVIQLLSFSHIYNAQKLKYCCTNFIIHNITPLLELKLLNELDDCILKELSTFYFENKREIWCRVITPYSTAPSDELITSINTAYPVSFDEEIERTTQQKTQKRRTRTHKTNSFELNTKQSKDICDDHCDNDNNLVELVKISHNRNSTSTEDAICNRLKSIKFATETLDNYNETPLYTKLKYNDVHLTVDDFPVLNTASNHHSKFSNKNETVGKHKIVRLSQKQRKRLSSESSQEQNLSESPKNPWKLINNDCCGSPQSSNNFSMNEIISNERKQKENLVKIQSKLLIHTQIEDKAIDELEKFYNCENVCDEIITVTRVDIGIVASPIWVPRTSKLTYLASNS